MTVKEYIKANSNKSAYTIKIKRKSYLCTALEAYNYFGNNEVNKITYKYNNFQLPVLHIA